MEARGGKERKPARSFLKLNNSQGQLGGRFEGSPPVRGEETRAGGGKTDDSDGVDREVELRLAG